MMLSSVALVAMMVSGQDSLAIRFIGNEAVSLSDGRMTIVTDFPYQPGYSNYMTYPDSALNIRGPVVSVIAHRHRDHFAEERFLATDWHIVGPREVTASLPSGRVVALDSVVRIGDAVLRPFVTEHAGVEHYSWLIEWKGQRFFFVGDTEDPSPMLDSGPLDIAFVSSWLRAAAQRTGRPIPAKKVVLYHHQHARERCDGCVVPRQGEPVSSR